MIVPLSSLDNYWVTIKMSSKLGGAKWCHELIELSNNLEKPCDLEPILIVLISVVQSLPNLITI